MKPTHGGTRKGSGNECEHDWSASQRHSIGAVYTIANRFCRKCNLEQRKQLTAKGEDAGDWIDCEPKAKQSHGGKRKGSGKKPKPDKRTSGSISLPPKSWAKLERIAKRKGVSRSECVNRLIEWLNFCKRLESKKNFCSDCRFWKRTDTDRGECGKVFLFVDRLTPPDFGCIHWERRP